MMNVGSGDMNWGGTQYYSPVGEQVMPTEDVGASAKAKSRKGGSTKGRNWSSLEDPKYFTNFDHKFLVPMK